MSFFDTLSDLAKAGVKKADEFSEARKAANNSKRTDGVFGGLFKKIDRKDGREMYEKMFGYKLDPAIGVAGVIGVTGMAAASFGMKSYHEGSLGEISGGDLPNTMSTNLSPAIEHKLSKLGTEDGNSHQKAFEDSMNISQYGVEPEIVFAMHELRN